MMYQLTAERRESLLTYCRLEEDDLTESDLAELEGFFLAACGYMEDAGVALPPEGTHRRARYDLLVNRMVLTDWDNRGAETPTNLEENKTFRRMLNQLKLTEVSNLDT